MNSVVTLFQKLKPEKDLVESDDFQIVEVGGRRRMFVYSRWSPKLLRLCLDYEVEDLSFNEASGWSATNLAFWEQLSELPKLRRLGITASIRKGWRGVEQLTRLEDIHLVALRDRVDEIDFLSLPNLRTFSGRWLPEWSNLAAQPCIEGLRLREVSCNTWDLTALCQLRELRLAYSGKVQDVLLPEPSCLQSLELDRCRRAKVECRVVANSLKFLSVNGASGMDLDEWGCLRKLKRAHITAPRGTLRPDWFKRLPENSGSIFLTGHP